MISYRPNKLADRLYDDVVMEATTSLSNLLRLVIFVAFDCLALLPDMAKDPHVYLALILASIL